MISKTFLLRIKFAIQGIFIKIVIFFEISVIKSFFRFVTEITFGIPYKMSTFVIQNNKMLNSLITSKTRLRLLVKFFINATNAGYLRGLATEMQENTNAIRKELNNLSEAGYILRTDSNGKIMYQANTNHPLFSTLQTLLRKHLGIDQIVETVVERMGEVSRIFIVGDYAQGIDSGEIEVIIEGSHLNEDYIEQLLPKIKNEINKEIKVQITKTYKGSGLLIFENK